MNRDQVHMLRFIDLGLLLLLAFLSVAELNPTLQVPLPSESQTEQQTVAARITFDRHWSTTISRLDQKEMICETRDIASLRDCLQSQSFMQFLVAPDAEATVQQIVTVLDLCNEAHHRCELEPIQP